MLCPATELFCGLPVFISEVCIHFFLCDMAGVASVLLGIISFTTADSYEKETRAKYF